MELSYLKGKIVTGRGLFRTCE